MGQEGKELADIEGMVREGSPAISEDGKSVMDAGLYRKAMKSRPAWIFRCWLTARTKTWWPAAW